ncbi:MAG: hydrogenase iron-sulfur subunit [Anaerolineae bacterium]|nr:hydrogenase iron-sulfur subunit [Anaerolineae bacterium]
MSESPSNIVEGFEPKIVSLMCNWCSYTAADSAGIARMQSPSNVLPVRVMCSARVSAELILKAFMSGADGVIVLGCHIGDCHYDSGNHRTAKRIPLLRKLLIYMGIEPDRLRLDWVSAAESPQFARVTTKFVEDVRALGPLSAPLRVEEPVGADRPGVMEGGVP